MTSPGPAGVLFVVATPLGNLEDLSARALRTLRSAQLIACEDTRRTARLLRAHDIKTPTLSYHEHNEAARTPDLISRLQRGDNIALVSDAGTPGISDPGERLVGAARAAGIAVLPVPGPSAAITALSVSGLPASRFLFVGFLPSRATDRRRDLRELRERTETLVFYESPLRIAHLLADALSAFGDRPAFLCREATKVHEEYVRGTLSELRGLIAARGTIKGEIVLVVAGAANKVAEAEGDPVELLRQLKARGLAPRAAAREAARLTGRPARDLYRLLLELPDETS